MNSIHSIAAGIPLSSTSRECHPAAGEMSVAHADRPANVEPVIGDSSAGICAPAGPVGTEAAGIDHALDLIRQCREQLAREYEDVRLMRT